MLSGASNLGLAVTQAFGKVGGHHKHQTQTGDSVTHIDQHGLGQGGPRSSIPTSLNLLQPRCSSAMSTAFPNGTWVSWPGQWPPPCTDKARNQMLAKLKIPSQMEVAPCYKLLTLLTLLML